MIWIDLCCPVFCHQYQIVNVAWSLQYSMYCQAINLILCPFDTIKTWEIKRDQEITKRKVRSKASIDVLNCYNCRNQLLKKLKWIDSFRNGKFTISKLILSLKDSIFCNCYVHLQSEHLTITTSILFISGLCRVNFLKLENSIKETYDKLLYYMLQCYKLTCFLFHLKASEEFFSCTLFLMKVILDTFCMIFI